MRKILIIIVLSISIFASLLYAGVNVSGGNSDFSCLTNVPAILTKLLSGDGSGETNLVTISNLTAQVSTLQSNITAATSLMTSLSNSLPSVYYPLITNPSNYLTSIPLLAATNLNYRAGTAPISSLAITQTVTFSQPLPNTNYAITLATFGGVPLSLSYTLKTTNGFQINLATGLIGGATVEYIAWPIR